MAMTQGLGYQELDRWLQKPRPLLFTFHLLAALPRGKYEPDSWQLNSDQKLESLNALKQQGNECFKKSRYAEAVLKYQEALQRIDSLMLGQWR